MTRDDVKKNVVRGQYIAGDEDGQRVPDYRNEVRRYYEEVVKKPIPPESVNSTTETFVAIRLFIDNWRWSNVPFYLRTGKRLPKQRQRGRHPVQGRAAGALQRPSRRAARAHGADA